MTNSYILNSAVITAPGTYRYQKIDKVAAKGFLDGAENPISAIGYDETVTVFNLLIEPKRQIAKNRVQVQFGVGDRAIVFRVTKRVEPDHKGTIGFEFIEQNHELGLLERIE